MYAGNNFARQTLGIGSVVPVDDFRYVESPTTSVGVTRTQTEEPPQSILAFALQRLHAVDPVDKELQEEKTRLIAQASRTAARWDEFLSVCGEERQNELAENYKQVRTAGREAFTEAERLQAEFQSLDIQFQNADEEKKQLVKAVQAAREEAAKLPRWHSEAQAIAAAEKIERAENAARVAIATVNSLLQQRNEAAQAANRAKDKLNSIANEEHALKAKIEGRPFVDLETGLSSSPIGS